MLSHTAPKFLIFIVSLDLVDPVFLHVSVLRDPAWLVLNNLSKDVFDQENAMQGSKRKHVHSTVIVRHILRQLFRCKNDQVDADKDAKTRHKLNQVHKDADVNYGSRIVLLDVLAHSSQLDRHADYARKNGEKRACWKSH